MRAIMLTLVVIAAACGQVSPEPQTSMPIDVGPGRVAWFDITTTDLRQSREFYGNLFDWQFTLVQGTDQAVEIVSRDTAIGTIRVSEGQIGTFNGLVYVQVDDVVASCRKAEELGAMVAPGFPFNLPGGRGAIGLIIDPAGHPIGVYSRTPMAPANLAARSEQP